MRNLFTTLVGPWALCCFCTVSAHEIGFMHHLENRFAMPVKRKDTFPRETTLRVMCRASNVSRVEYRLFDGTVLATSEAASLDFAAAVDFPHEGLFEVTAVGFDDAGVQVATTYATMHVVQRDRDQKMLVETKAVTVQKDYAAPMWSPAGDQLVFTGEQYRGLFLVDIDAAPKRGFAGIKTLSNETMAGFKPVWHPHADALLVREAGQSDLETPATWVGLDGSAGALSKSEQVDVHANFQFAVIDDHVCLRGRDGETFKKPVTLSRGNDKFFGPQASPDGEKVLFEGISSGIWVVDLTTGARTHVGLGNHPTWGPNSEKVYFDIADDGHFHILNSDLFVYDLVANTTTQLTDTPNLREQRPAVAQDGRRIAFDGDGAVFTATLPAGGE